MRRFSLFRTIVVTGTCFLFIYYFFSAPPPQHVTPQLPLSTPEQGPFSWGKRKEKYPVKSLIPLPSGKPKQIPAIQHAFQGESETTSRLNKERRDAVESAFTRSWNGYRSYAWMQDELIPVNGGSRSHFGGWAATLVDSLDTLWIMDMKVEFEEGVEAVKGIDFTTTSQDEINVFETTIRYLGGLLSAYELTNGTYPVLMEKALELGEMLYAAFDTPNRMPIMRWHWKEARSGGVQEGPEEVLLAEIGSLSLEFTRLSQNSGNPKFFDAIQRIYDVFEAQQSLTKLPGMWPLVVNARSLNFTEGTRFTLGAMADSTYEYLPKQYLLLGGLLDQPRKLYEAAIKAAKEHLFFRPMEPEYNDILISGDLYLDSLGHFILEPRGQHLSCFVGGMMGIAAQIFSNEDDLIKARKLVDGCIWAYDEMPTGIMPEFFYVVPCNNPRECIWDPKMWHRGIMGRNINVNETNMEDMIADLRLPPGFTDIPDRRYILRPEAIESVFILYRITGDETLRESAWDMFQSIEKHTTTEFGNTALSDTTVLPAEKADSMESFWTAETLKYFYLIFSPPGLISLDEFVFNTEAHPFRRPR